MKTVCVVLFDGDVEVIAKDATAALAWLINTGRINEDSWYWDEVKYIKFTDDQLEKMKCYGNRLAYNMLNGFDFYARFEEVVE